MQDPMLFPPAAPPPPSTYRVPILILILLLLVGAMVLPYGAEQLSYAMKRGELRAKSETAAAELVRLGENAELVKLSDTSRAFRLVAQRVEASVVHINTESVRVVQKEVQDEWGFRGPRTRGQQRMRGQGSGVIVDAANGYVLTNFHVIQDASSVNVKLADGRKSDDVKLVGYDVLTDLAVLKIGLERLTAIDWGDSNELEVGDWVLAIGNPYGLDRTVTFGIVSAKDRRGVGSATPYQEFLQTDAAVNPGNSGGPLVDIHGRLIGINTAIIGESFQGISFAIPSNAAHEVYNKLIEGGKVARGWLGVGLDNLSADQVKQLGVDVPVAILVTRIVPDSPAAQGGLRKGDIILRWNDKPVTDAMELTLEVARTKIGTKIAVVVLRDDAEVKLTITIGQRPDDVGIRR
ncbi:MAG: trypsin-like peptidase domain-containing protein [Planctomycetia bacterium]|nr:trypsin-like peptidase domain-containing protein [Planctomycetia bacterium]